MPETWGSRSRFEYSGSVETGTDIVYGRGWKIRMEAEDYTALRHYFLNRVVPAGTSRSDPPADSLGAWLQANVTKTAIASYVASILILEGYAKRIGKHDICVIK